MFVLKIITQFSPQDDIAISSSAATITYVSWFHDYFAWQHVAPVGKTARHLSSPVASPASHTFGSSKTIILMISYRLHFWLEIFFDVFGEMWQVLDQMIKCPFLSQLQVTPANLSEPLRYCAASQSPRAAAWGRYPVYFHVFFGSKGCVNHKKNSGVTWPKYSFYRCLPANKNHLNHEDLKVITSHQFFKSTSIVCIVECHRMSIMYMILYDVTIVFFLNITCDQNNM